MEPAFHSNRLTEVTLDDASIIRRTPEVEHERRVALFDLVEENALQLIGDHADHAGPYRLFISVRENRLTLRFADRDERVTDLVVALTPFRGIIKDYFLMCESYYEAIKSAPPDRIQTLDMARRSVHNEGSELLQQQLAQGLEMDLATARRLFTLICVLHIK